MLEQDSDETPLTIGDVAGIGAFVVGFGGMFVSIAAGLVVLYLDALQWLKTGVWVTTETADYLPAGWVAYVRNPDDWFGLHKLIEWFVVDGSLAVFLMTVAPLGFVGFMLIVLSPFASGMENKPRS